MLIAITALLFAATGVVTAGLGLWLASLGGSPGYVPLGLAFLVVAAMVARRSPRALPLYALVLLATLVWALVEVGLDWWQLMPRGGVPVLLGLWLWLPPVRNRLTGPRPRASWGLFLRRAGGPERTMGAASLGTALALASAAGVAAMLNDPHDMPGSLPGPRSATVEVPEEIAADWPHYGGGADGQRYSSLAQITPATIDRLTEVWRYRTGDLRGPQDVTETTYQVTPLKIGERLYLCTPHNLAIALEAATGREIWRYDPKSGLEADRQHQTCRGVTYWSDPLAPQDAACAARILLPTSDARLIALDAGTGQPCPGFGQAGAVDLMAGMPFKPAGYYYSTSPPVVAAGRVIVGGAVNDNFSVDSPSGVIRAFDARSGRLLWNWDSGRPDDTRPIDIAGGETYTPNSPNSWSVFSVDPDLGLVYVPLGNQVPDQLGMGRSAAVEAHSSSVVALDIMTGQRRWVFQTVHHDLWDMDVPAQPVLIDLAMHRGPPRPALVQPTKQGDIYVLDRATGEPILPVTEARAPGGAIPEDFTTATQPGSRLSFKPADLQEADMWGLTLFDQLMCRIDFHRLNYRGRYTPPSLQGSLVYPGNFGVFNWGSVAVDPERQVMFGMPVYLAFVVRLVPAAQIPPKEAGAKAAEQGLNRNEGAPYGVVMGPFLGPLDIPCQAPPWGYVAAADLTTGNILWRHPNGTVRDMTPLPLPFRLGVPGIGGPVMTRGGVAFLAATVDNYLRGYDVTTGREIWRARLPAGGQATPMTYAVDGRQFVLIVAGGHGSIGTDPGDYVIAYALAPGD